MISQQKPKKYTFAVLSVDLISCKIADIGLGQSNYMKDDCSTSKLLCCSLINST